MRYWLLLIVIAVFAPASGVRAEETKSAPAHTHAEEPEMDDSKINTTFLNASADHQVVYGKEDAPVTIIEYASLSCSHCRDFHLEVSTPMQKDYIDSGKVRIIFRHFPLNLPALRAAMLTSCFGLNGDKERQRLFLGALFKSQDEWAHLESEEGFMKKLKTIAKIGGMEEKAADACLANKDLEKAILEHQLGASKELGIRSTPALFVNNKRFIGTKTLERVAIMVDTLLKDKNTNAGKPESKAEEEKKQEKQD